jgi:hypothetical protein
VRGAPCTAWPCRPRYATASLAWASGTAPTESALSILFIGNSLTHTNDLPEMVRRIADADGRTIRVAMVAGPNLAVVDHTTGSTEAPEPIDGARWDFVVLQQGPTPASWPSDPVTPAPADTIRLSAGGGPC